jgi:hypothetical protein
MASLVGGFFGRLDEHSELTNVTVLIPLPPDADPFTARYFLIQTFEPPCTRGKNGQVSARIEGVLGPMERELYPQYENYWSELGLAPADRKGDRAVAQVDDDFSQCGCIPELSGCDKADEAVPLEISAPVRARGFLVTLNLRIAHLDPGTAVRGLVALIDQKSQDRGRPAQPDRRQEPAHEPEHADEPEPADEPERSDEPASQGGQVQA